MNQEPLTFSAKAARKVIRREFSAGGQAGLERLISAVAECERAELQTRAVLRTFLSMPWQSRWWWVLTGRL